MIGTLCLGSIGLSDSFGYICFSGKYCAWSACNLVFEDLLNQLEIVLVDDVEVLRDIDISNTIATDMIQSFVHVALAEFHHVSR